MAKRQGTFSATSRANRSNGGWKGRREAVEYDAKETAGAEAAVRFLPREESNPGWQMLSNEPRGQNETVVPKAPIDAALGTLNRHP